MRLAAVLAALGTAAFVACGSGPNQTIYVDGTSSGSSGSSSGGPDAGDAGGPIADGGTDGPITLPDGGKGWDGTFKGPLSCSTPGSYAKNSSGSCGAERWSIKTGADSAAAGINLLPKLTGINDLAALPAKTFFPATTRISPVEQTVYALRDVRLTYYRLEDDSDYHIVLLSPTGTTMITEIPYPADCTTSSVWQCEISRARAAVDAQFLPQLNVGKSVNYTVSAIGVGFYDPEHGQFGALPNGIELHPLLAICFGAGCDPTQ
jgi:hypothetical protein